jgi:RNA polymerase sigma factor for flagellar operon FliA
MTNVNPVSVYIEQHTKLVCAIARNIEHQLPHILDKKDLEQEGMLGLIDAAKKYDDSLGVPFSAYAARRIGGAILDSMRRLSTVSRSNLVLARRARGVHSDLVVQLQREPDSADMAKRLNIGLHTYQDFKRQMNESYTRSLSELLKFDDGEEYELGDLVSDPSAQDALSAVLSGEEKSRLNRALGRLSEHQRLLLKMYYHDELCMRQIAENLGCCESRVSQIHSEAIRKLRRSLKRGDKQLSKAA